MADLSKGLSPIGEMAADSGHSCHDSGNQPDAPTQTRPARPGDITGLLYPAVGIRNLETHGKSMAWQSICEQVGEVVRDPKWFNEDLVDAIGVIPAQLFRRIGHCLLPPYVGPAVVTELFENAAQSVGTPHPDDPTANGLPTCGMS